MKLIVYNIDNLASMLLANNLPIVKASICGQLLKLQGMRLYTWFFTQYLLISIFFIGTAITVTAAAHGHRMYMCFIKTKINQKENCSQNVK